MIDLAFIAARLRGRQGFLLFFGHFFLELEVFLGRPTAIAPRLSSTLPLFFITIFPRCPIDFINCFIFISPLR
jgi:hypothetical protein